MNIGERTIIARLRQAEEAEQEAGRLRRMIATELDAYRLLHRPKFPTPEQRAGIVEAARRIKASEAAKSHHGDPCGPPERPYVVGVVGNQGFLCIGDGSPYKVGGQGYKLWSFTEAECIAFRALIEAEGLTVVDSWTHASGLSFIARNASP